MREDDTHTSDQARYHERQLAAILEAFGDGKISADEKRRQIADENALYYGPSDRLAIARPVAIPDVPLLHAEPADPAPFAAAIRRELGWAS